MITKTNPRYILFTQPEHETIRFDLTYNQVKKFIAMWNAGFHINVIYLKNNISKVTAALMVMDLEMTGKIAPRKNGLEGWREDYEYNQWWTIVRNDVL